MKPRQPIPRISKKRLAANGGKTPFLKGSAIRKKTAMPWNMCRTCHRAGTPSPRSILRCPAHPVGAIGECGQCGKRRPLVTCHNYDFRAYSFRKRLTPAIRKKPRKPLRKVNPKAKAKRKIAYRKMLAGKEYKAARKEAMERAGGQCERDWASRPHDPIPIYIRCPQTEDLHAHHLRYPKSRPLRASDLLILCKPHHEMAEASKPHKTRMF